MDATQLHPTQLLSAEALLDIKRLEIRSRRSVDADLIGRYRSSFRGSGLLFSDLRTYEPGDDIKHIHWKATARTGRPFVKTYEEERQLRITLAVDVSASTLWGAPKSKHERALQFAALISMLAQQNQDAIGLCLFGDSVVEYTEPSTKRSQFQRVLRMLLTPRPLVKGTNIGAALTFLRERTKRSSIIFIVSDFLSPPFEEQLSLLASRNDVIGVSLINNERIPSAGLVKFSDAETGEEILVDTSSKKVREALIKKLELHKTELQSKFQKSRSDLIEIGENPLRPLITLMEKRSRRNSL